MPKTFVTYLLDRTGSMGLIKQETIDGFNTYLSALQQADNADDIVFTLVQFHGRGANTIYQRIPVSEAEPLSEAVFRPRGRTPSPPSRACSRPSTAGAWRCDRCRRRRASTASSPTT